MLRSPGSVPPSPHSTPMRVLHVMASAARGGGAAHLVDLLPALGRAGWDCEAAVGRDGPLSADLGALGVPVHHVDLMGRRLAPLRAVRLARLTARLAPDVVHLHGTRTAFFHAIGAAGRRRARRNRPGSPPAVYTAHGLAYRKEAGWIERRVSLLAERVACGGARAVISVSRADLTDLERRGYVGPGRGFHVANAVPPRAAEAGDRTTARRRLGLPADALVVGTVSRLVPQKAVGDLIDAVAGIALAFRGGGGPPTVVVAGDGPLRARLERRVEAGTNGARVMLLGARDDVSRLLPAFDVFVLSSHWEGEPIALLEAMAAGLPCVATATEGAREILGGDAAAGRLVPVGDVARLGDALVRLLRDAGARQALGEAARARVRGRTPDAQAGRVVEVYRRLLAARRVARRAGRRGGAARERRGATGGGREDERGRSDDNRNRGPARIHRRVRCGRLRGELARAEADGGVRDVVQGDRGGGDPVDPGGLRG